MKERNICCTLGQSISTRDNSQPKMLPRTPPALEGTQRGPQGTRTPPDNFGSAAGGFTQAPGGGGGPRARARRVSRVRPSHRHQGKVAHPAPLLSKRRPRTRMVLPIPYHINHHKRRKRQRAAQADARRCAAWTAGWAREPRGCSPGASLVLWVVPGWCTLANGMGSLKD